MKLTDHYAIALPGGVYNVQDCLEPPNDKGNGCNGMRMNDPMHDDDDADSTSAMTLQLIQVAGPTLVLPVQM